MAPSEHLIQSTRRFVALAGDRASHLDPAIAESHYRRALALFPAQHPGRPAIQKRAAWAAGVAGHIDEAITAYEMAIEAGLFLNDHRIAGDAKAELANLYWDRGDMAAAHTLAVDAVDLLRNGGPSVEMAHAVGFLAFEAWTAGRADDAVHWSTQVLQIADTTGLQEIRGLGLMGRGQARLDLDDPRGIDDVKAAVQATKESLEQGRATTRGSWQLLNWQANLVEALWLVEGTAAALEVAAGAQHIATQRGLLHPLTAVRADGLKVLFDSGGWDELLHQARAVTAHRSARGNDYWTVVAEIQLAHVLIHRGQLSGADNVMTQVLTQAKSIGDLQVYGAALEVQATLHFAQGDLPQAMIHVRHFVDAAGAAPARRAWHLPGLVRVCAAAGQLALADQLIDGTDLHLRRHACSHRTATAVVAEARGGYAAAAALYENAVTGWQQHGHLLKKGYALLGVSRCAMRRGDPTTAV